MSWEMIEDNMKNLCRAVCRKYLEVLLAKPLECYNGNCIERGKCLKARGFCNEQKFVETKKFFKEHIETPKFWFHGGGVDLLFEQVKKLFEDCNCLEDVRKELKLTIEKETPKDLNKKHFNEIYRVYDKRDNSFVYESDSLKHVAERLNSSLGVVRATMLGKNTYLKDDYIIKSVIK